MVNLRWMKIFQKRGLGVTCQLRKLKYVKISTIFGNFHKIIVGNLVLDLVLVPFWHCRMQNAQNSVES